MMARNNNNNKTQRRTPPSFVAVVVGEESIPNLQLSNILRQRLGAQNVYRYLELRHFLEFLSEQMMNPQSLPCGIFYDVFSFRGDLTRATDTIGFVRSQYPKLVFCLYMGNLEVDRYWSDLRKPWQSRLEHYYKLYKQPEGTALEPTVRRLLQTVIYEAMFNMDGRPVRIAYEGNVDTLDDDPPSGSNENSDNNNRPKIFISYSRQDWTDFVQPLVNLLEEQTRYSIWIDQHLLVGGDDWMDEIGQALEECQALILVMSPDALASKFVKMEYRYVFNHDKLLIPLLYRPVAWVPPELSGTQHIDFTAVADGTMIAGAPNGPFERLIQVLETKLSEATKLEGTTRHPVRN